MTDVLTFYATNDGAQGCRYALDATGGARILVYTPAPLGQDVLQDRKALTQSIQTNGGLMVETAPLGGGTQVRVTMRPAGGYTPPEKLFVLDLMATPRPVKASASFEVPLGDHVVVPVDQASEGDLEKLWDLLRGLPEDTAATMLDVLRRPGLEAVVEQTRGDVVALARRGRMAVWILGAAAGVALAGAAAVAVWVGTRGPAGPTTTATDAGATATATQTGSAATASATATGSTEAEPPPPTTFDGALRRLAEAIASSNDTQVDDIRQKHFKVPDDALAWGLFRLALLHLKSEPTLASAPPFAPSVRASLPKLVTAVAQQPSLLRAVAMASCRAWNKPELHEPKQAGAPPLALPPIKSCDDVAKEEASAIEGIETLTSDVKKRQK